MGQVIDAIQDGISGLCVVFLAIIGTFGQS